MSQACCGLGALALVSCAEHVLRPSDGATPRPSADDSDAPSVTDANATIGVELDASPSMPPDTASDLQDGGTPVPNERDAAAVDAMVASASVRTSLVLPQRWTLLDAGSDPFEDRLPMVDCPPGAVVAETLSGEQALGVETGLCNYVTAFQPLLREVQVGELLKVRLWHFELSAPEPTQAHAAVMIGGLSILDERVPIPGAGGLLVKQSVADRRIPAGAPVYFHLHNHGANSWALVEVSSGPINQD